MALEIERKFLVRGGFKPVANSKETIKQAYLSTDADRTVRIRQKGDKGYITIKGRTSADGTTRLEWEKEISPQDVQELLTLCDPDKTIDKTRYCVDYKGFTFEVDEFHGSNEGLLIAEIELPAPDTRFEKPEWLGEEVTGQQQYYNSQLSEHPYSTWAENDRNKG